MARKRFTEKEVVGIVARQLDVEQNDDGYWEAVIACPLCGKPITESDLDALERDHERALELYGEDFFENCRYVHVHCHKAKTRDDIARIAKAKRQAGETGQRARRAKRDKPSIQGRGFETNRDGKWKAKINARTEPRT